MEILNKVVELANQKVGSKAFEYNTNSETIQNTFNRYVGNDIDMYYNDGIFELRITGVTENYNTIDNAVQGLIDMTEI